MGTESYFPPLYGKVDCWQCEIKDECQSFGKEQRDRRDFTPTDGRCPRLPDKQGFVDKKFQELYAKIFPLVHAERGTEDSLDLSFVKPGEKRTYKVYQTKSGYWYYRTKDDDGYFRRKVLYIQGMTDRNMILRYMDEVCADYCLFHCNIMDYYV